MTFDPRRDLTLTTLLLAIAALSIGTVVGLDPAEWDGFVLLATGALLMLAVVGGVCGSLRDRPRFVGFATFGWGYLALAHWYTSHIGPMPTVQFLPDAGPHYSPFFEQPVDVRIVHHVWAMVFAILGGLLAGHYFQGRTAPGQRSTHDSSPGWWKQPVVLGLAGSLIATAAVLAGWLSGQDELAAGIIFLLSFALMGMAFLGALTERRPARQAWAGAATFGLGYLAMAFSVLGSPELPTNHLLHALFHSEGPAKSGARVDDDASEDSRRVRAALERPVALHFAKPTPLLLVLDDITAAISGPNDKAIPIYATGRIYHLSRETRWDHLAVSIDGDSIPAKEALRECLRQVGLTYRIEGGRIHLFPDAYDPVPYGEDPFMLAGHSMIALLLAWLGGFAAPFVLRSSGLTILDRRATIPPLRPTVRP